MGRNSGSTRIGISVARKGSTKVKKALKTKRPLSTIKDRRVEKELARAISRFHSELGVREKDIALADLSGDGALGLTYIGAGGKAVGILLDENWFDRKKEDVVRDIKSKQYDTGFKNRTNAPLQHTMTHELAHATWNEMMTDPNAKAAGKVISAMYDEWSKDKTKKGYGTYAEENASEFWAEVITKALHGEADKYTRKAKQIVRHYKL